MSENTKSNRAKEEYDWNGGQRPPVPGKESRRTKVFF